MAKCNEADCEYPKCDCWAAKQRNEPAEMRVIKLPGYGPGAPEVYLPVSRIISFHLVDFNGNYGTHIDLPGGRYIRVGAYPEEVKAAIDAPTRRGEEG